MPETIITPTPERGNHDEIAVQPAGRNNAARIYVKPFWETWREKEILTKAQAKAAQMFVEDHEQLNRGSQSCLASLDRIDHAGKAVVAEGVSEAQARIDAVRERLGPSAYNLIYCALIYGTKPKTITGPHHSVSQGMVIAYLEVMVQVYGLKS